MTKYIPPHLREQSTLKYFTTDVQPDLHIEKVLYVTPSTTDEEKQIENHSVETQPVKIEKKKRGGTISKNGSNIDTYLDSTLHDGLKRCLALCNYKIPTPVQQNVIPYFDNDLMVCAMTGSGKTGAFLIPIINKMLESGIKEYKTNALILAPTRELVHQICHEAKRLTYRTGISTQMVYGGSDANEQIQNIQTGCDMLCATPGRLIDFIDRKVLSIQNIETLVLDEADRMLDMGFEPQIRSIVKHCQKRKNTYMFSATFPKQIQKLAGDFLSDYVKIVIGEIGQPCKNIDFDFRLTEESDKFQELTQIIQNKSRDDQYLIFAEKKVDVDNIEQLLNNENYKVVSIHGDRSQDDRDRALNLFRRGIAKIMVATDVASRGLDISQVTHVINYTMPKNIQDFVHRVGRTGRNGKTGCAINFMNEYDQSIVKDLCHLLSGNDYEIPQWFATLFKR